MKKSGFSDISAKSIKIFLLFASGGTGYYLLELLYRGYSHYSMAICGGVCFFLIYLVNARLEKTNIFLKSILGAIIITFAELVTGCIVNLIFHLDVWDYSDVPLNLSGQICLPYSFIWFLLCFPVNFLCRIFREKVFTCPLLNPKNQSEML